MTLIVPRSCASELTRRLRADDDSCSTLVFAEDSAKQGATGARAGARDADAASLRGFQRAFEAAAQQLELTSDIAAVKDGARVGAGRSLY
jgi:hypothetical protein